MQWSITRVSALSLAAAAFVVVTVSRGQAPTGGDWPLAGGDLQNTRSAPHENRISIDSASSLRVKWSFTTGGDVSATPTVSGNALYVPDWAGNLYRFNANNGAVDWVRKISSYTGIADSVSRTSPAISGNTLVIGTQQGGYILALEASSGEVRWRVKGDPNEFAIITQSPVISGNRVYVGVSSSEEGVQARVEDYVPSFRGSVLALDLDSGAILWRRYIVPSGYTGGAVWGSTPVVDARRNSLYITTGNNYTIPSSAQNCVDLARIQTYPDALSKAAAEEACLANDDYIDAVMSLDLDSGAIKWVRRVQGADTWTVACGPSGGVNPCPDPASPDYDFGSGANLFTVNQGGQSVELLGAGQKSGVYWTFNPDDGRIVWATMVGPGGSLGGIEWGSATDGKRVYVGITNNGHKSYTLAGTGTIHNAGSWAALDAVTGRILWQVKAAGRDPVSPEFGGAGMGAVTIANGVMLAGSTSGDMVLLDAATGTTLASFPTAGSVNCGPSVIRGTVYWGSGYGKIRTVGISNTTGPQLFAFEVQ